MDFLAYFKTGGVAMYPLLLCSILIWAIFFEKCWLYFTFRRRFLATVNKVGQLVKEGKESEALGLCQSVHEVISAPILVMLSHKNLSQEAKEARVIRRIHEIQLYLKKYLWLLGTIGAVAPFIGLFGTVLGIIRSFESIAMAGKSGFSVVAAGLSEALITTAAGILIAVVAVLFYNYFQSRLGHFLTEIRNQLGDLSDLF